MSSVTRRRELGTFLRTRRDRLRPEDLQLPAGGRRRTPGLRREEVAQAAGVGVTWYTWLEQGRDINPSQSVLSSIAETLRMTPDEAMHLFTLAGVTPPATVSRCTMITEDHLELLDRLLPLPACFQTARFDVLAYNRSYRFLIADATQGSRVNCLINAFLDPAWEEAYGSELEALRLSVVRRFRSHLPSHLDDPTWHDLIARLERESPDFRRIWAAGDVQRTDRWTREFRHPQAGLLRLRFGAMWLDGAPGVRFTPITPVDEQTSAAIARFDEWYAAEPRVQRAG